MVFAGYLAQHRLHFGFGQDGRQAFGLLGVHDAGQLAQFVLQHFPIQKAQGAEGLALGRGRHALLDRQMSQEQGDLRHAHIFGVAFLVMENVTSHPVHVGGLGAQGIVFEA
jgi:hypothetical protein